MTPDQRFARRVRSAIAAFVLLFVYFLAADLWMPITPQAQLTRPVLRLAPRVSGQVLDIVVSNNAHVQAGQLLFRLDPEPFRLAVNAAELALEQAAQDNAELDASLAAARADKLAADASAQELARETERLGKLVASQHVSRQLFEQTQSQRAAASAKVAAASARIHQLAAERGAAGDDNLRLRQARNALDQARLQLQYSEVRAERAGTLSNLQLSPGAFVAAGSPVAALVADEADVSADFREKALRYVGLGDGASVVFDALPGRIFAARVSAIDAGVKEGQLDANGDLAAPATSDRWVRDAQRQRLHVLLEAPPEAPLPSGAKATVQLYPHESPLAAFFGRVQIRLISLLHYIY
ncbi:HlyD family secretion protein [Pseudomonas solani]|uniref:HlyD family secretion protein n=1 Tax=Pseudomonas TaxID=286 RepID=UPI0021DF41EF|nr:HlyD family secretion protein [Pseudomonas sp. PDM13]MCU9949082.1 HlyD family secretion protein [Pseudomonas sp. PDM13]